MTNYKEHVVHILRSLRLLAPADRIRMGLMIVAALRANRRFKSAHPEYPVPPYTLAFDAFGHVRWDLYRSSGITLASYFVTLITTHSITNPLNILEWGCGPGRIIRHITEPLGRSCSLTGTDLNPRTIAWCRNHLPGIAFHTNNLYPPLEYANDTFNAILCRSVFTHLTADLARTWFKELLRVTCPGGIIILTTQGDYYRRHMLTDPEIIAYDNEGIVMRGGIAIGGKWFTAFHSPAFMHLHILPDVPVVAHLPGPNNEWLMQDVWVVRKPLLKIRTP